MPVASDTMFAKPEAMLTRISFILHSKAWRPPTIAKASAEKRHDTAGERRR
jgi:hypothetical protein